jgi:UDP-N-acetylmuramoylalanine--D-glutamate ligase
MSRIVIIGGGESGSGAAVLAKIKGFDVFLSDFSEIKSQYKDILNSYQIDWEEKQHTEDKILDADLVIKSPGVSDKVPLLKKIFDKSIPVISEIEFASKYTNAKLVCITGSNGKTTTTMLVYHLLKNAGLNVGIAGNVGQSFAFQVATKSFDIYVLELSSFQLDGIRDFKADIAILLNITPDHLDRYEYKFQNYIDSKFKIIQNQLDTDAFIFWEHDPVIKQELSKRNVCSTLYPFALEQSENTSAYLDNNELVIKTLKTNLTMSTAELALQGMHNTFNSMAAGLAASIMNVRKETIRQSLQDFKGVEHRLEYVATVKNVKFVNDSKATNVNSCWYALQSINTPIILILGGTDKGNDYTEIEELISSKVKLLIFLGVDNEPLHRFFDDKLKKCIDVNSMEQAVKLAYENAVSGDTVLLSPCCASFDLFQNYEDRGTQFKTCVRNL